MEFEDEIEVENTGNRMWQITVSRPEPDRFFVNAHRNGWSTHASASCESRALALAAGLMDLIDLPVESLRPC